MRFLTEAVAQLPEFGEMLSRVQSGDGPVALTGLGPVQRAHIGAALRVLTGRPLLILCADEEEAARLSPDLESLSGEKPVILGAREFTFYNASVVSRQWEHRRLAALYSMSAGKAPVVLATVDGMLQRTIPKDLFDSSVFRLALGESYDLEGLADHLTRIGYTRCQQVEGGGQFAVRGGILDYFSPGGEHPVRAEFFGDELDSLGYFDTGTQRKIQQIQNAVILPAAETLPELTPGGVSGLQGELEKLIKKVSRRKGDHAVLLKTLEADRERLGERMAFPAADRYMDLIYPRMAAAADYMMEDAVILVSETARIRERAKSYAWQLQQDAEALLESGALAGELAKFSWDLNDLIRSFASFPVVMLEPFAASRYLLPPRKLLSISAKQIPSYGGNLDTALGDLGYYVRSGYRTAVLCANERRAGALKDLLAEHKIPAVLDLLPARLPEPGSVLVSVGQLSGGLEYPGIRLAVITEGQILASRPKSRSKKREMSSRERLAGYSDLSPGDLVVHVHHGVGRFVEIVKMPVDGAEKDYIKIAYAGGDNLYVPATQLDLVSKYIGVGETAGMKLSRLGGAEWSKAKAKAKSAAKDLAKGLIALYAERMRRKGHAFAPDTVWQTEFEEAFEYKETEDQLRCSREVKENMEVPVPMDRLLCGDVGYGKTEVAFRAAMKCILDGKQAAILVPTTVLAQQHYATAMHRFRGYPVKIDVLSRFRSASQHRETVRRTREGGVDLLIGTHRLLQKDVKFKDLGLLIIDEEQRFGVSHKERLKEIARQVDVLTLTATPIPRTLNMALSGIRDISMLEEPPQDRQPVQTYVLEHDWGILADAMRKEIGRGGQVYYLHNRIETIERTAARISGMMEGARVAVAHGKMDEEALSDVMQQMIDGEIQILVCTTIIETGIDIPNVNTLIIEDADKLGLAQLHQIRGRVGRSSRHAFAYMTFRQGKALSETASKRLSAIREFAEFGSGFKIAMRDLEIRGAGNVLGPEQSGYMLSVGYDMYLMLLEEAVLEEKGERPVQAAECAADLAVSANIPERYVPSAEQRIDLYRRIALIRTKDDAEDMVDELIDRYGEPPASVRALISVALLRAAASAASITEISQKEGRLILTLAEFDLKHISSLCARREYKGKLLFSAGERPYLSLRVGKEEDILAAAEKVVAAYAQSKQAEEIPDMK
ncbi:transcription-repair coupling factor [Papillibacter cinnamivorans]|uniref:Transcription-repair-coupling factor n=1 Tax=Papillibacter cinnamivorans DSM 12816 TaxID=1122930 RepID=A0A1W1ZYF2_9FIRM|nr:transcription-repair coupling factor [Papillibacter cinnamivorans]SMC53424.1 transcription-repair coupling factor (superfamily II helicase) [Papillibacter cinnamivorans DSM 12816]